MAMSAGSDDGEPMMEMNTTPLIDVMLVLLIMFIITIPVATHAVNIDLPNPAAPPPDVIIKRDKNKVVIMPNNDILWNGTSVNVNQLTGLLKSTLAIKPEPELQYQPDAQAPYDTSVTVLNIIKGSGVSAFGFVGNEQYAGFGKAANAPKVEGLD
ncbi:MULTISPECIES: biopolymer transporter ExbD [unclassified Novosphingobium]|uniref:ExbD/TolR family protein n=1 Tax=unclassified Novosphingobium TaxID=2644732 RepID=UPI000EE0CA17|nr:MULTISPECIES: biopolymer transporter ExbD [unclassified Novosphingobium]HCF25279.1 biopolymer transporter ExbD [Novosphingobium sp.]HQV02547.1 biopolymer transporter ExbD [Novosphingobium sp.]